MSDRRRLLMEDLSKIQVDHVLIKPFSRSLAQSSGSSNLHWISNDAAVINQHGAISLTNYSSYVQILQQAYANYQVISYYQIYAVSASGQMVDLRLLANAGRTITAQTSQYYTGSGSITYNAEIFNGQQAWPGSITTTCPSNISTYNLYYYNNGTSVTLPGCFIYVSVWSTSSSSGAYGQNYFNILNITIDGVRHNPTIDKTWPS